MAIQKVNESPMAPGLIESMKKQGQETAKPEAVKKPTSQMQSFQEAYKGFKIDTKA